MSGRLEVTGAWPAEGSLARRLLHDREDRRLVARPRRGETPLRVLHVLSQQAGKTGSGIYLQAIVKQGAAAGFLQRVVVGIPADSPLPVIPPLSDREVFAVRFGTPSLPFPVAGMSDVMPYESTRFGLATGDNGYFILDAEQIASRALPWEVFRPILPGPRHLPGDEILADERGIPRIERRRFLLDTRLPERDIQARFPALFSYLQEGRSRGVHERYLCRHRAPWYAQENRPPAPIVCTYLGRSDRKSGRPFRFLLNHSQATLPNVYLAMYPTPALARAAERDPGLMRRIWEVLNQITPAELLGEGRVYGGGLHKLEPRELANVDATAIARLLPGFEAPAPGRQVSLFGDEARPAGP